jgi:hypothetical protein
VRERVPFAIFGEREGEGEEGEEIYKKNVEVHGDRARCFGGVTPGSMDIRGLTAVLVARCMLGFLRLKTRKDPKVLKYINSLNFARRHVHHLLCGSEPVYNTCDSNMQPAKSFSALLFV